MCSETGRLHLAVRACLTIPLGFISESKAVTETEEQNGNVKWSQRQMRNELTWRKEEDLDSQGSYFRLSTMC